MPASSRAKGEMNQSAATSDRSAGASGAGGGEAVKSPQNDPLNDRLETLIGACATMIGAASFAVLFTPPWLERLVTALVG